MKQSAQRFTPQQLAFQELFIGTLIYAVVLGFFNDYTHIVTAKSFSTIFYASVLLEILTYLALKLKSQIIAWLRGRSGSIYRVAMVLSVWFVMFVSKFVFVWALDMVFGDYIHVDGFFGILAVVISVTVIHRLAYYIFDRLERD